MQEEAVRSLARIRRSDEDNEIHAAREAEAFEQAVEESKTQNQGSWADLFTPKYLSRTIVGLQVQSLHSSLSLLTGRRL
jgi:hypothetical protein